MKEAGTTALTKAAGIADPIKTGMMKSQVAGGTTPREKVAGRVMQIKMMKTKTRKTKAETMTRKTRVEMVTSRTRVEMMTRKTRVETMISKTRAEAMAREAKVETMN